jgi:uncharacterized protein (DUF1810 family)
MRDPFDLQRFVDAQQDSYETALAEISHGRKRSHWMWYIFPQIAGLGHSAMARHYAIGSLDEAAAYLAHPLLGPRYIACTKALQDLSELPGRSAETVFGAIDAMKLRSSLTLFEAAGAPQPITAAIERWYGSERDPATLAILARRS